MKKYIHILSQLWLSKHASKIYVALLEHGVSNMTQLTEYTGLQRIQIYRNLPVLLDRGFMSTIKKGKRKIYAPVNPDILRSEYEQLQKNTFHVLDELWKKYKTSQNKTNIVFGQGKKAIENVFHDVLSTFPKGGVFYRISSELDSLHIRNTFMPKQYRKQRDTQWIERMMILSESAYKQKERKLEREEKIVDSKDMLFDDNIMFTVYGDKISLVDINKETAIIIESSEMARFQEKIFKLLFKKL